MVVSKNQGLKTSLILGLLLDKDTHKRDPPIYRNKHMGVSY